MGMSSSQARLLSLTAKQHNIELKAQRLQADKLRLANESNSAYKTFLKAMDAKKTNALITLQDGTIGDTLLTAGKIYKYDTLSKQYSLKNDDGKTLISSSLHNAYKSTNSLTEFLQRFGLISDVEYTIPDIVKNPDYSQTVRQWENDHVKWESDIVQYYKDYAQWEIDHPIWVAGMEQYEKDYAQWEIDHNYWDTVEMVPYREWEKRHEYWKNVEIPNYEAAHSQWETDYEYWENVEMPNYYERLNDWQEKHDYWQNVQMPDYNAKYQDWVIEHNKWEEDMTPYWEWEEATENYNKWQTEHDKWEETTNNYNNWQTEHDKWVQDTNNYNNWKTEHAQWVEDTDNYNDYLEDYNQWVEDTNNYNNWQTEHDKWEETTNNYNNWQTEYNQWLQDTNNYNNYIKDYNKWNAAKPDSSSSKYGESLGSKFASSTNYNFSTTNTTTSISSADILFASIIDYSEGKGYDPDESLDINRDWYNGKNNQYTTSTERDIILNYLDIIGLDSDKSDEYSEISAAIDNESYYKAKANGETKDVTYSSSEGEKLLSKWNPDGTLKSMKQWAIDLYCLSIFENWGGDIGYEYGYIAFGLTNDQMRNAIISFKESLDGYRNFDQAAYDKDYNEWLSSKPTVVEQPGTRPVEPTKPGREPSEPTKPGDAPVAPTVPGAEPVEPTKPGREPSEPPKPGAEPVEPPKPSDTPPAKAGDEPIAPTKPSEPKRPTRPTAPVEPTKPEEPIAPPRPDEPIPPTKPGAEPIKPIKPEEPILDEYLDGIPEFIVNPDKKIETTTFTNQNKAQWYINQWYKMEGQDKTAEIKDEKVFDTTTNKCIHIYSVENVNKSTTTYTTNADWGTEENENYLVIQDELLQNDEWLHNMLKEGLIQIQVFDDFKYQFINTSVGTDSKLEEVYDTQKINEAESEYETTLNKINIKEAKADEELSILEAERNAISIEQEQLKKVVKNNIDLSFKLFS